MTYFYAQLFAMDTEIRAMFPAAMDVQRRRFFEALGRIADAQQSQAGRDRLVPYLQELGRAHRKFGVRERHYEVFRRALLATLQRFAAPRWNETAKHAWEMAARLHVRAVTGGLVSPVLVHQVRAGDPLVLGAPAGARSPTRTRTGTSCAWPVAPGWPRSRRSSRP